MSRKYVYLHSGVFPQVKEKLETANITGEFCTQIKKTAEGYEPVEEDSEEFGVKMRSLRYFITDATPEQMRPIICNFINPDAKDFVVPFFDVSDSLFYGREFSSLLAKNYQWMARMIEVDDE